MARKRRYAHLLEDPQVNRWYLNVARGSVITADVYLRRFGSFCEEKEMNPAQFSTKMNHDAIFNILLDTVTDMQSKGYAGSYIESVIKSVKSWLKFNHIELVGEIKIDGVSETPTLVNERTPSQQELNRILNGADLREKVAIMFIAACGGRIEILGTYRGDDGLRVRDLPEMEIDIATKSVHFEHVPTIVIVRSQLSKAEHQYFSFLSEEGCNFLKEYLENRMHNGEALTEDSPIIQREIPWMMNGKGGAGGTNHDDKSSFIRTGKVGEIIRRAIRRAGFSCRPYAFRSYFASRLLVAESEGLMLRDFRVFHMGHKGDIEHRYTVNRHMLPPDLIEKMRGSYRKSQRFLQSMAQIGSGHDDVGTQVKKQMLLTVGYKQEEVEKMDIGLMTDEGIQNLIREKLFAVMMNNGQRQRVTMPDEVEKAIAEGWEWMGNLPNGKAVLRLPSS